MSEYGHVSGVWARMEDYVGHPTLNVWCACHRSNLAMELMYHQDLGQVAGPTVLLLCSQSFT